MGTIVFNKAPEYLIDGTVKWMSDDIRAQLINSSGYIPSATHDNLSSVTAGKVGTPVSLTGKSTSGAVLNAANSTFSPLNGPASGVLIYKAGATDAESKLLAYLDGSSGFPTPAGTNITVVIDWSDANGILRFYSA